MIRRHELSRIGRLDEAGKTAEAKAFYEKYADLFSAYFGNFQPDAEDDIEGYCDAYYRQIESGNFVSPSDLYKELDVFHQLVYELPDGTLTLEEIKIRHFEIGELKGKLDRCQSTAFDRFWQGTQAATQTAMNGSTQEDL